MISAQQATGEGNFLGFLRTYLMTHKYKTVDVYDLKSDFTRYVKVSFNLIYQTNLKNHTDILEAINWDDELRNSKYPILETDFRNLKINASENLASEVWWWICDTVGCCLPKALGSLFRHMVSQTLSIKYQQK